VGAHGALTLALTLSLWLSATGPGCGDSFAHLSKDGGAKKSFRLYNASNRSIILYWNGLDGTRKIDFELPTGEAISDGSFVGHVFVLTDDDYKCLGSFEVSAGVDAYVFTDAGVKPSTPALLEQFEKARANAYERREVGGYVFHLNKNTKGHPETEQVVTWTVKRADEAKALLPERYRPVLAPVELWLEWERRDTSNFRYQIVKGADSIENKLKWGGIEINSMRDGLRLLTTTQPLVMLHEFVHAIHDHMSQADKDRIHGIWEAARVTTRTPDNYSYKNDGEFFAGFAEAWFNSSRIEPRTAEEIREQQPKTAALFEELLGPAPKLPALAVDACTDPPPKSRAGPSARVVENWVNGSARERRLEWVDPSGALLYPMTLAPGAKARLNSNDGSVTRVSELDGGCVGLHTTGSARAEVQLH
jgi:hypothetical protein